MIVFDRRVNVLHRAEMDQLFLVEPFLVTPEFFSIYREVAEAILVAPSPVLSDIGLMAVGSVVAWFM